MNPPRETCGVCLGETSMPVRINGRATPLRLDGNRLVRVLCELCAAELGITAVELPPLTVIRPGHTGCCPK